MMLAKQSPSSIVYPTLVDVNANEEKPAEELQHILNCLVIGIPFSNLLLISVSYNKYFYPSFGSCIDILKCFHLFDSDC